MGSIDVVHVPCRCRCHPDRRLHRHRNFGLRLPPRPPRPRHAAVCDHSAVTEPAKAAVVACCTAIIEEIMPDAVIVISRRARTDKPGPLIGPLMPNMLTLLICHNIVNENT